MLPKNPVEPTEYDHLFVSIHELAALRHAWKADEAEKLGIIIRPYDGGNKTFAVNPHSNGLPSEETARSCMWDASIYMGGGKWGDHAGVGKTPLEALRNLHAGLLSAHFVIDERRKAALERAQATVERPSRPGLCRVKGCDLGEHNGPHRIQEGEPCLVCGVPNIEGEGHSNCQCPACGTESADEHSPVGWTWLHARAIAELKARQEKLKKERIDGMQSKAPGIDQK